jgi:CHAT domain-containing protein
MPFGSFKIKRNTFKVLFFMLLTSCLSYSQDSLNYYNTKISKLYAQGNKSQSDAVFQQKSSYLKRQNNAEEYLYAWWEYFMLEPVEERLYLLKNALKSTWRPEKNEAEKVAKLHVMINLAYHQKSFGNIYQSIQSYEKAMYFFDQNHINNYDIIDYALKPLANNCTRIGDYDRAEELLVKTLKLTELPENKTKRAGSVLNLSIFYYSVNKHQEAIQLLFKEQQNQKLSPLQKAGFYSELSRNYLEINDLINAKKFADSSNSILNNYAQNTESQSILMRNELTLGNIEEVGMQIEKALVHYQNALQGSLEQYGKYNRETAKIYVLIAAVYNQKKDTQRALDNLRKALTSLLPTFNPLSIQTLPSLEMLYPENTFLEIFDLFATIQFQNGNHEKALQALELAFQTNDQLRFSYAFQNSKLLLQNQNNKRTEQYLNICFLLYQNSKASIWAEKAFFMVEKNKASVLSEELNAKYFRNNFASDSLLIREKELQMLKAELNTKLALLGPNTLIENKKKKEELLILSEKLSREWVLLQTQIKAKYPEIAREYQNDRDIHSIQKKVLTKNTQFIEFFTGPNFTFIFSLSHQNPLRFTKLENVVYESHLNEYLSYYQPENIGKMQSEFMKFNDLSYLLFQFLIADELEITKAQNLLIIPDGNLNYLPFEALLTSNFEASKRNEIPYLIFEKQISYAYSIGILLNSNESKPQNTTQKAVGFFPVFQNQYRGFSELTYSLKEAESIGSNYPLTLFANQNATKTNFIQNASRFPVIHISTHAQSERDSLPAFISFYDKTLYLTEIYGYQFPIDVLVLSSCETGIGHISKGEGVMSLARGFSYAGVKKLVVSLWEINDQSTALLMGDFYKNFAENHHVSTSLHQAKINYLRNPNIPVYKKTPNYWAGLISISNQMEYNIPNTFGLIWMILLVVLGSVMGFYFFTKIKRFKKA